MQLSCICQYSLLASLWYNWVMKRIFLVTFFLLSLLLLPFQVHAQALNNKEVYMKAIVEKVINESTTISDGGYSTVTQTLRLKIQDPPDAGKVITIDQGSDARLANFTKYQEGQTVIVDKTVGPDGMSRYVISDTYRIPQLIILSLLFALFAIGIAGRKGLGAVIGLVISLGVIVGYIVPQILFHNGDPLTVSIIGSCIILFVTTFLAHGFSRQTAIAVGSTFLALFATYFLSIFFVNIAHLAGLGTEDSYLLEIAPTISINPQGLFLGGIIIGTLGALNDVTTTQVASIFALFKANREQTFLHLIEHGFSIGKEHIASMINTLVLAYAGTSLPIFIFLVLNPNHLPLWVILNTQQFGEEIVRTIAGSMGLMLSVPIATLLGAYLAPRIVAGRK